VPSIFAGHYDPSFTLDLCCTDLKLIEALSQASQTQNPMTARAQERFEAACDAFGGDQPELLVCKLIEDAAGTDLRVDGAWPKRWEA
jgi:3-hydroxyisobutyrate dehydrogenase